MSLAFPKIFRCEDHVYNNLVLAAGTYQVTVSDTHQKTTKEGTQFLQIDLLLKEGDYKGQIKPLNIWLWSGSEKAVAYNASLLGKVGIACGVKEFSDTRMLHGKSFQIIFNLEDYDGKPRNNVVSCSEIETIHDAKQTTQQETATQQEDNYDAVPWG